MPKILLLLCWILIMHSLSAQNLVINPGAEILPRGTGWTIISEGSVACTFSPTDNYLNWTIIPDGTANYPFDHTTGAAGGTVFFSGCSDFLGGPFELQQIIDVSADATNIDLGGVNYTFGGFIQTPVSPQTDQGRFIVDYLNASNVLLGASYTSAWQSNLGGSGAGWNYYTNTRLAPAGTRKVRIRLQAQLFLNRYAVNVHFDDISLTKPIVLPVKLISFTGNLAGNQIHLQWKAADEINIHHYELEQSANGANFNTVASIISGQANYNYVDKGTLNQTSKNFYRLKIVSADGKFAYSVVLAIKGRDVQSFTISPNPAKNMVTIDGLGKKGIISIVNSNGKSVYSRNIGTPSTQINIAQLPAGLYMVRFSDGETVSFKKLVVQTQ